MDHKLDMGWMFGIALSYVAKYKKSIARYPNIKPGQQFNGYKATVLTPPTCPHLTRGNSPVRIPRQRSGRGRPLHLRCPGPRPCHPMRLRQIITRAG
jgi:hypothetical protein